MLNKYWVEQSVNIPVQLREKSVFMEMKQVRAISWKILDARLKCLELYMQAVDVNDSFWKVDLQDYASYWKEKLEEGNIVTGVVRKLGDMETT